MHRAIIAALGTVASGHRHCEGDTCVKLDEDTNGWMLWRWL